MSGHSAATSIEGFVYVGMDAFSQSAINFTGQNAGAGQYKRVRKVLWTCLGCVTVAGVALSAVAYVFAPQLLSLYVPDSAAAIEYGIVRMTYVCCFYSICGMLNVCTGVLRGMQVSLLPMLISIAGVCGIRLVWIYTIFQAPQFHTLENLYLSYPISWIVTLAVTFIAVLVVHRKRLAASENRLQAEKKD